MYASCEHEVNFNVIEFYVIFYSAEPMHCCRCDAALACCPHRQIASICMYVLYGFSRGLLPSSNTCLLLFSCHPTPTPRLYVKMYVCTCNMHMKQGTTYHQDQSFSAAIKKSLTPACRRPWSCVRRMTPSPCFRHFSGLFAPNQACACRSSDQHSPQIPACSMAADTRST